METPTSDVRTTADIIKHLVTVSAQVELRTSDEAAPIAARLACIDHSDDTAILMIDDSSANWLIVTRSPRISGKITLAGETLTFDTAVTGPCIYNDRPAVRIELPERVVRVQRRESFRIETPIARPLVCMIGAEESRQSRSYALRNISVGGLLVVDSERQLNATIGNIFRDCVLELNNKERITCTLEVRTVSEDRDLRGRTVRKVGMRFVDLKPGEQARVQRLVTQLEFEQSRIRRV
jgi:c-di-GMP-binding flagellar brake protein YcgR